MGALESIRSNPRIKPPALNFSRSEAWLDQSWSYPLSQFITKLSSLFFFLITSVLSICYLTQYKFIALFILYLVNLDRDFVAMSFPMLLLFALFTHRRCSERCSTCAINGIDWPWRVKNKSGITSSGRHRYKTMALIPFQKMSIRNSTPNSTRLHKTQFLLRVLPFFFLFHFMCSISKTYVLLSWKWTRRIVSACLHVWIRFRFCRPCFYKATAVPLPFASL